MSLLTPDQHELIVISLDYENLRDSPGWKRVQEFMEAHCDRALAAMRENKSSDPRVADALQRIWRERENFMHAIHANIAEAIENRKSMIQDELEARGASPEQIESILEEENLRYA